MSSRNVRCYPRWESVGRSLQSLSGIFRGKRDSDGFSDVQQSIEFPIFEGILASNTSTCSIDANAKTIATRSLADDWESNGHNSTWWVSRHYHTPRYTFQLKAVKNLNLWKFPKNACSRVQRRSRTGTEEVTTPAHCSPITIVNSLDNLLLIFASLTLSSHSFLFSFDYFSV